MGILFNLESGEYETLTVDDIKGRVRLAMAQLESIANNPSSSQFERWLAEGNLRQWMFALLDETGMSDQEFKDEFLGGSHEQT